ncbi:ThiF family adenylyltransferase [Modestobacter sp. Leaf380]|uniref:ThiF family adenylyltransferase n=1 Tax=Modestobacter sp. Leaf380 TaxID=1736356 RepID=UPI0006F3E82D|nr:ThiF family adenylyltransferase [Modestobacter sp. Leaf380]KQS73352.1 thiamine biosynthesis protein ThiF [Modestobacter sp. Leaf380]
MTDSAHPLLPPTTPLLRLDGDCLQVGGADGGPGLRVGPVDPGTSAGLSRLLRSLDGSRTVRAVHAGALAEGLPADLVHDVLHELRSAGLTTEVSPADLLAAAPGPADRARVLLELPTALASRGGGRWRDRAGAVVVVEGATRVGVPLAGLLAAAGVGRVHVRDRGTVRAEDTGVGGLGAADEGRPRALAAADAVRRVAPHADLRPPPAGRVPDLVVLCHPWAALDPLHGVLQRDGVAHLVATVRGETGVVGPLVVPGLTGCLRCAEATRRDEDPAWSRVSAQLREGPAAGPDRSPSPGSGSSAACLATALTAAGQVLAHLDGEPGPVVVDAVLELHAPDLLPHRRAWPPHPDCPCRPARR